MNCARIRHAAARGILLIAAGALLFGCGAVNQSERRKGYEQFYNGDMDRAAVMLEEASNDKNRLLHALDRGMIAHTRGELEESNRWFTEAEQYLQELLTSDVSDEVSSFLVNDYRKEYRAEDFEAALVHPIKAINYLLLNDREAALVECRAANIFLTELQEKYEHKNAYSESGFARYLSGIIYEAEGKLDDALIDYRFAHAAFLKYDTLYGTKYPASLRGSIGRVSEARGKPELLKELGLEDGPRDWVSYAEKRVGGEIVFILENGQAPFKREESFHVGTGDQLISFAFPVFERKPTRVARARLVTGGAKSKTDLVEDVASIAVKDLDDRYHRVLVKQVARATLKYVEVKKAQKKNEFLGALLNVINSVNERADLRSWETLPANFQIARIFVEPGYHETVQAELLDRNGSVIETVELGGVELKPGETRFLFYRTLR